MRKTAGEKSLGGGQEGGRGKTREVKRQGEVVLIRYSWHRRNVVKPSLLSGTYR